jgi:TPR repeat protein
MQWFRKAADMGNADAEAQLGLGYMEGLGQDAGQGHKDYRQAAYLFGKAAAQGDGFSQIGLGQLYENGWGVTQDTNQAQRLYSQAASNPHSDIAKLGQEYLSRTQSSAGGSAHSTDASSDLLTTAIVGAVLLGGIAALMNSGSSDSQGKGSSPPSSSGPYHPPAKLNQNGIPCYLGAWNDPSCH